MAISETSEALYIASDALRVSPYEVKTYGSKESKDGVTQSGVFVAFMDYRRDHPLVKGVPGPNVRTALNTLRRVIRHDYWIPDPVKQAAFNAIDARLAAE